MYFSRIVLPSLRFEFHCCNKEQTLLGYFLNSYLIFKFYHILQIFQQNFERKPGVIFAVFD